MKKFFIIIYTLSVLFSCGDGGEKTLKMDGIKVETASASGTSQLTNEANSPKCEVSVNLQYADGKNAKDINKAIIRSGVIAPDYLLKTAEEMTMKQIADSFVKRYQQDYKDFYAKMYAADRQHPQLYDCQYSLKTTLLSHKKGIITAVADITMFAGGQHPTHQTVVRNISTDNYKLLTIDDLYIHGYKKTMQDIIIKKLCKTHGAKDLDELKQKLIFADGDIYISQNFIIYKDKVVLIYCEDEIAPHDMGEIRIEISDKEMGGLVKKSSE